LSPEEGHKREKPTPACPWGPASLLILRLDISGLLMDSQRCRQPQLAISCTNSVSGARLAFGERPTELRFLDFLPNIRSASQQPILAEFPWVSVPERLFCP
jgi:hypothetical protein